MGVAKQGKAYKVYEGDKMTKTDTSVDETLKRASIEKKLTQALEKKYEKEIATLVLSAYMTYKTIAESDLLKDDKQIIGLLRATVSFSFYRGYKKSELNRKKGGEK